MVGNCGSLSDKVKAKISASSMGKAGTNAGKNFDEEHKFKLSQSNLNKKRPTTRRFTTEQEKEICRLYTENKKSMYKIAQLYECQRSLIGTILEREGYKSSIPSKIFKNKRSKFSIEEEKEICDFYSENKISVKKIAEKYNCPVTTMRSILIRSRFK